MAQEKKVNETKVTERTGAAELELQKLILKRKAFSYKSRSISGRGSDRVGYSYFIAGRIGARDIVVDISARDKGGYEVLDILYTACPDGLELVITEHQNYDDKLNKITSYEQYEVVGMTSDGYEDRMDVKPDRPSDKALLKMLYQRLKAHNDLVLQQSTKDGVQTDLEES